MILATPSDNEQNESHSQGSSSDRFVRDDDDDDDDEEESIEEIPLKKRQKTNSGQTGAKLASQEDKALRILNSKAFF